MTVEIHQAEIEALIKQRMASGTFHDVEELLLVALKGVPEAPIAESGEKPFGTTLLGAFAEARRILDGVELDLTRDRSPGRLVDLS